MEKINRVTGSLELKSLTHDGDWFFYKAVLSRVIFVLDGSMLRAGASIPVGQGGHVPPNIYEGETSMVMSPPQYFRSDVVYFIQ